MVNDQKRKSAAEPEAVPEASAFHLELAATGIVAAPAAPSGQTTEATQDTRRSATLPGARAFSLVETLPTDVRLAGKRVLPPDLLRNRLSQEQQADILKFFVQVEDSSVAVQATFVAAMLASDAAKSRTQLTRLAPLLGIALLKETQQAVGKIEEFAPVARLTLLVDLLPLLDTADRAERKTLRAVTRAFAPTVGDDMSRFAVTRILEKRLAKATEAPPPVPLTERAAAVCELYAALAQCRFGAGKQGQNAYRAGLMGMLPPKDWKPYPETPIATSSLDATLAALSQVQPTGKTTFSEGMARVISVGGHLTAPLADLLRVTCLVVDCPLPVLPDDVVFEENGRVPSPGQASAR